MWGVYLLQSMCEGQKTTFWSQFPPFMWVLGFYIVLLFLFLEAVFLCVTILTLLELVL